MWWITSKTTSKNLPLIFPFELLRDLIIVAFELNCQTPLSKTLHSLLNDGISLYTNVNLYCIESEDRRGACAPLIMFLKRKSNRPPKKMSIK